MAASRHRQKNFILSASVRMKLQIGVNFILPQVVRITDNWRHARSRGRHQDAQFASQPCSVPRPRRPLVKCSCSRSTFGLTNSHSCSTRSPLRVITCAACRGSVKYRTHVQNGYEVIANNGVILRILGFWLYVIQAQSTNI